MKFTMLLEEYIALNVYNPYTEGTLRSSARLFMSRTGITDIEEIDLTTIAQFKKITLQNAKPVTFNGYLKHLRQLGKYALSEGYLSTNWFEKLKQAPVGKPPKKVIERFQLLEVLRFISENHEQCNPAWFWCSVIRVLYSTGMRRRQLVGLKREDIDLVRKEIRMSYGFSKTLKEWHIPLDECSEVAILQVIEKTEKATGKTMLPMQPLFDVSIFNKRYKVPKGGMTPESITSFFRRLNDKLGGGIQIGAHRLRHTAATEWCNPDDENPDLFAIQDMLGHSDLKTTRGYVKTPIERMRQVTKARNSLKI